MAESVRLPDVKYPETNGIPMPDGDYQGNFYRYAVDAVKAHFATRPEVYVTGDLFIYLEEGNPKNCVAPDLFVMMNAGHDMRDVYKVWEEPGGMPDFILEIVSPSTWRTDLGSKRDRYAALGVGEYWLYDPHARFMNPALAGYRLAGDSYEPLAGVEAPDGTLTMHSDTLGLDLRLQGEDMRFFDPARNRLLLDRFEAEAAIKDKDEVIKDKDEVIKDKDEVIARQEAALRAAEIRMAELERALGTTRP